jgi:beta-phosphoglucomutase
MSSTLTAAGLLVDFNGTLSDDEQVLYKVYAAMFAEHGRTLGEAEYFETLAGRTDGEIFARGLDAGASVDELTRERVQRYRHAVADGATIRPDAREALVYAASRVPVAIVTSAWREEVEPLLRAAGLDVAVTCLVCADDVVRTKPDPEPYLLGCARLGVEPRLALAVEDTDVGVAAATAAGIRVLAVRGTVPSERLSGAERLVDRLSVDALAPLLG